MKYNRAVVIGGAGFIGSHLVEQLLAAGFSVRVVDNFYRGTRSNLEHLQQDRIEFIESDILDLEDGIFNQVDVTFHLAALWLLECTTRHEYAIDVNVKGVLRVLEQMVQEGCRRMVFSSSASVYGDALYEPIDEKHPLNNHNFYGATKIAGEQILHSLYQQWQGSEKHFDYLTLRYMNVYGERQDYSSAYTSVILKMLNRIFAGESPQIHGDGKQSYDFIHVKDVARANLLAGQAAYTDSSYNISTGIKTSLNDLATMLLQLSDSNLTAEKIISPENNLHVKNRVGSIEKAANELNFRAKIELKEGLPHLIQWYQAQQKAAN